MTIQFMEEIPPCSAPSGGRSALVPHPHPHHSLIWSVQSIKEDEHLGGELGSNWGLVAAIPPESQAKDDVDDRDGKITDPKPEMH